VPSSIKWVFCKRNIDLHMPKAFEAFKSKYPDEKIDVKDCAGKDLCSLCLDVPFAIRNGAIVHAGTERDLYWKLDQGMEFLRAERLVKLPEAPPAAEGEAKPAPAKPAAPKAEAAKPEASKAEAKPEAVKAETKPEASKAEAKPEAVKAETKPEAPKAEAKPEAVKAEAKPEAAKPETEVAEAAKPEAPAVETKVPGADEPEPATKADATPKLD